MSEAHFSDNGLHAGSKETCPICNGDAPFMKRPESPLDLGAIKGSVEFASIYRPTATEVRELSQETLVLCEKAKTVILSLIAEVERLRERDELQGKMLAAYNVVIGDLPGRRDQTPHLAECRSILRRAVDAYDKAVPAAQTSAQDAMYAVLADSAIATSKLAAKDAEIARLQKIVNTPVETVFAKRLSEQQKKIWQLEESGKDKDAEIQRLRKVDQAFTNQAFTNFVNSSASIVAARDIEIAKLKQQIIILEGNRKVAKGMIERRDGEIVVLKKWITDLRNAIEALGCKTLPWS
jgi:hypothetical protein